METLFKDLEVQLEECLTDSGIIHSSQPVAFNPGCTSLGEIFMWGFPGPLPVILIYSWSQVESEQVCLKYSLRTPMCTSVESHKVVSWGKHTDSTALSHPLPTSRQPVPGPMLIMPLLCSLLESRLAVLLIINSHFIFRTQ